MLKLLESLRNEQLISELSYQFAKLIDRKQQPYGYTALQQNLAVLLAALMTFNMLQGNTALKLNSYAALTPFGLGGRQAHRDIAAAIAEKIGHLQPDQWQQALGEHIAFSATPERIAPMLFQHQALYLYRYWQAEYRVAHYLLQAVNFTPKTDIERVRQILDRLFAPQDEIDWQKLAAATALRKQFCLISGGPGTGKTRTVARLLSALQLLQMELQQPLLKIALAAPTGKAAARLKESITANIASLPLPESVKNALPSNATTLHRLLGIRPYSEQTTFHHHNRLPFDLLVVDEISMIDLSLMEKLVNALKPSTRLIILGDKDQLASVEAGAIIGELGSFLRQGYSEEHSEYLRQATGYPLFSSGEVSSPICDSLCHLRHSYRFNEHSGIGKLASLINAKQARQSWQLFDESDDLHLITYPSLQSFNDKKSWQQHCAYLVVKQAVNFYRIYLEKVQQRCRDHRSVSINEIFSAFQQVRFLAALRVSELGVERLNQQIADALAQAGLVQFKYSRENYLGKPILITENAPQLNIFSGDIGLILPDEQGNARVYFDTIIEHQGEMQHLSLSPSRVPSYEAAYVMTVHKSQGSEFDHTVLVMPTVASPILTKELVYTALTRAKTHFTLLSNEAVWLQSVKAQVQRQSGLKEQLLSIHC